MRTDPYTSQPDRAFWSRAVARAYNPGDLLAGRTALVRTGERVASAGSCFAANMVPYLEGAGFAYVRAEPRHPAFAEQRAEALGYDKFSAAYGNVYTVRQMLQLVQRALGQFTPAEDRWVDGGEIIDPFRPGLIYRARSHAEFDALQAQHLTGVLRAVRMADVFVFTLGLTEAWVSAKDGAVFPACPGTVAGTFDAARHRFHNFSAAEVRDDLFALIALMRTVNPALRFILTVSPVPLVATAGDDHVVVATTYSKSVLRVAAGEAASTLSDVAYFPSYEMFTGPQAPHDYFQPDRREVAPAGVEMAMAVFVNACETGAPAAAAPAQSADTTLRSTLAAALDAECEEAMSDV